MCKASFGEWVLAKSSIRQNSVCPRGPYIVSIGKTGLRPVRLMALSDKKINLKGRKYHDRADWFVGHRNDCLVRLENDV